MPQQKVGVECHHRKQRATTLLPWFNSPTDSKTDPPNIHLKLPMNPSCHTPRNPHISRKGCASRARAQRVARNSYVLLPPAPASAAAFLTEIGIRPFSQNTKHKAALCKLGPSCFLSATEPRAVPRLSPSSAAHHPRGASPPGRGPAAPSPAARAEPRQDRVGKLPRRRRPARACAGARRRPPEAAGPRSHRGAPRGPPPPPRPEVCELRSPTAQSQRGPQKSLSSPLAAPPVPRAESSGAVAFRPWPGLGGGGGEPGTPTGPGTVGPGRRRGGRAEGKFQDRGHQQRRSGLRRPDTQRRAEGPPRARLGDRCPHLRSAPAPGPARDSLRNPIPPPPARPAARPPRRPSHSICRSALDSASRRSAPALRPPKSASSYPLACAPTDCRPRVAAAVAPNSFSLLLDFRGRGERAGKS